MALDNPDLAALNEADLQTLITNTVPEGRDLDYKLATYGGRDDDKREFLADVSSFANTAGGHLVIGMDEAGGVATALPGVALDPDAEIRRLDSLARDGLQPRLLNIRFHFIRLMNGNVAIVVRIPKSWSPPHRVVAQKSNRFWARGAGGKYEPDVAELKSLFAVAPSLATRVRDFRMERLAKIAASETPLRLSAQSALVLHVLPVAAFGEAAPASIQELWDAHEPCRPMGPIMGSSPAVNLDGVIITAADRAQGRSAYVQIWRDRRIEAVLTPLVLQRDGMQIVYSGDLERYLIEGLRSYMSAISALNVSPPFAILVGLVGTAGALLDDPRGGERRFDRALIVPSELICEGPASSLTGSNQAIASFLRPAFDEIANGAGRFHSRNFDAHGNWQVR